MSWRAEAFRDHFLAMLGSSDHAYRHATLLRRIDRQWGGLDEKIGDIGLIQIMGWARGQRDAPFDTPESATAARAALNCYVKFLIDEADPLAARPIPCPVDPNERPEDPGILRMERDLQLAVRRDLEMLEPGLKAIDGGFERTVPTGRIDILARDRKDRLVVIELKAGLCPAGTIEQALGYTYDIEREMGQTCRTIIIASGFPDRVRAAADRIPALRLIEYRMRLDFERVESPRK
jgi:hypothetical protein